MSLATNDSDQVYIDIQIKFSGCDVQEGEVIAAVLARQVQSRCAAKASVISDAVSEKTGAFIVELKRDASAVAESFAIAYCNGKHVQIMASDRLGFLYGVGKFLRDARYSPSGFVPGAWEDVSVPAKPVRGMYLATHFHNYYHDAPIPEIQAYMEDLALWGVNTVKVWYDMHHYEGIDDPNAQEMISRLRAILTTVKNMGLRIVIGCLGNEGYANSPEHLHADFNTGRSIYHCELCPSKPEAMELMLQWFSEELDAFADLKPDLLTIGPYDQGGCACEKCKPWGANGFLKIAQAKAQLAREKLPDIQVCLGTWLFDYKKDQGEWKGLDHAFAQGVDWCDYILADSHDTYPTYPLEHGVPGDLPLLNFPEISMWMMHPWGGFGANPLPKRFEGLWQNVKKNVSGGFPYSEGIYEDINKVLCTQFYWSPDRDARSILEEYIAFEFSPDVVDSVTQAIDILQVNQHHIWTMNWNLKRQLRLPVIYKKDPTVAFNLLSKADAMLTPQAKTAWRWRIVYLRGLIDMELLKTEGYWANDACEAAFEELLEIYHAQHAEIKCSPPTRQAVHACRSSEDTVTY